LTCEYIRALRLSLNMSQAQFSVCYHIPVATLQSWEQNRRNPDLTTQSYLHVISVMPDEVKTFLAHRHI
jgi:putative transcriptional regulator